ncbi:ATP-dependent DNA ligase [Nocardioides sp. zg-536]|uniref:DNA ligase n=1 Tax=Nocardioides faecalis TaxID=2803858 RepID=A0A938YAT2_9ACTN|nr:ATP-dependent DNA ligase [Nocardioides faecalis]MBM9460596.1 ATP-dependent DNA ligase [Nocardioides faecalis]MBS4754342.1 ATP-dependent DNA ligase [Nocardioides faecalis]QVI57479.1 ATP-dependent DNA ligase [Nocardioides faecalis]
MLLAELVAVSAAVAATRSRTEKSRLIAGLLESASPGERSLVAHYLSGRLRQRRTGLGRRGLQQLPVAAAEASLTVAEVDAAFEAMSQLSGGGSTAARTALAAEMFGRATAEEQHWLRAVALGEVRQGASEAAVVDALAKAADVPLAAVRRAAMLAGGATYVVDAAFDGTEALAAVGLTVGRPVLPMLASSAPDVAAALAKAGGGGAGGEGAEVGVDAKLDGIRIQVHRDADEVRIATRSLDDITTRLPEVVAVVRALPAQRVVLDGEALALDATGRPHAFQDTASRTARSTSPVAVTPYFFDLLHLDGTDLIDLPARQRWAALEALVPPEHRVRRWVGSEVASAEAFTAEVLAEGHEGVVVKSVTAPYEAGRRGAAWVKVKPVHTLDLVVLAVEHGSGRRRGWLSNIHLGARDDSSPTGFTMLGKTFKGMTDEMLAWQTRRFRELEVADDGWVVTVRPEQVVEVAFDGLQRSTRYPGGVALRFARVLRYRDDKRADVADSIETVRALAAGD